MDMKRGFTVITIIIAVTAMAMTGCKEKVVEIHRAMGTLEGPVVTAAAPDSVHMAMHWAFMDRYENIIDDKAHAVSVWSLVNCNPCISSKGYGIIVTKNKVSTHFPDIYHGNDPRAEIEGQTDNLWLKCGAIEGTGVQVERLYLMRFHDDNTAYIFANIDPYEIQQALLERIGYSIKEDSIAFYDGGTKVATIGNTITDMGGFDTEQPIWIGEQLRYDVKADRMLVEFVPGVKFTTGLVLHYEDMPTLKAAIKVDEEGKFWIGEFFVEE